MAGSRRGLLSRRGARALTKHTWAGAAHRVCRACTHSAAHAGPPPGATTPPGLTVAELGGLHSGGEEDHVGPVHGGSGWDRGVDAIPLGRIGRLVAAGARAGARGSAGAQRHDAQRACTMVCQAARLARQAVQWSMPSRGSDALRPPPPPLACRPRQPSNSHSGGGEEPPDTGAVVRVSGQARQRAGIPHGVNRRVG